MKNKKWKRFDKLTEKCDLNMAGVNEDGSCWEMAFEVLKEIVLDSGRKQTLEMLDDATNYRHDLEGWVEDCLDEIESRGDHELLLKICDDLLEIFEWPEYTDSDIRQRKVFALKGVGRMDEAVEYCREWMQGEPENITAATAGVYILMFAKEFEEAEKLVDKFIPDRSECTDDNDLMFSAASSLFGAMGKKKEKKQIDKALEEYDEFLGDYFDEDE